MAPIRAGSPEDALDQLRHRVATFQGARSLMRVRVTANGRTQSFKAQLVIPDRNSMELIAYTPVGTAAATIRATGDQISAVGDDAPEDLARSLSMYAGDILPAQMAMLLIGLPAADSASYTATAQGLQSAVVNEVIVTYQPPQFPPRSVTIRRGADVVTMEHLEIVSGP